ncbi:MAG: DMT family transporter [Candidatus Caldarchaeum sp.]
MTETVATLYGLASAFTWGAGDFFGGYASMKARVSGVVAYSQAIGCTLLLFLALWTGEQPPSLADLVWSMLGGVFSGLGLTFYYAALSRGSMGYAAPATGVLTAVVPAAAGSFLEGSPSVQQAFGFFLAFASIALVAGFSTDHLRPRTVSLLPAAAGLCFGLFLVFLGQVSEGSYLYPLMVSRLLTVGLAFAVIRSVKSTPPLSKALPYVVAAGVFDTAGSFFYLLARQAGRLDVAGVLSSLYPVSTVLLAKTILHEKLGKRRAAGIALAAAATTMINT